MVAELTTRALGARGSRSGLAGSDPAGTPCSAAASVLAAVPAWWEARSAAAGLKGRWLDVAKAIDQEHPDLPADDKPRAEFTVHTPAEDIGKAYVAALSREVRARHGRHYTPPDLARHLWTMTRRTLGSSARATSLPGLVRDRACGAGALLLPALREHLRATTGHDPHSVLSHLPDLLEGVDSDPYAVWLANVLMASELLPVLARVPASRRKPFSPLARHGDGLRLNRRLARVELLNPPYGRVRLSPEERMRWGHVLYGHANLYALFIAAGIDELDDRGVLAALVPTSFTSGLYFSRLRETLSAQAPLRTAAFVAERDGVFADVLQETCLAVFTRRRPTFTAVASVNGHMQDVARVRVPRGAGPWLLPRRIADVEAAVVAAGHPLRLADLGYACSTGPLVWNRREEDLGPEPGPKTAPVLWAADIDGGWVHRADSRRAMRYLRLREGDELTLLLRQPAVVVQRTTAPEQYRRLVVADLTAETIMDWGGTVVVENHVNVLRPNDDPLMTPATLAAVLATSALDRVVRSLLGSVAVSAYELESLPFPDRAVVHSWNLLRGDYLEAAVAEAYGRPG
jgi:adenine-specific DNA-methyltransferase